MPQYTSRDVGDPSQVRRTRQSMADLKLRRLTELNSRLREDLDRERIPVSQASKRFVQTTCFSNLSLPFVIIATRCISSQINYP